MRDSFDPEGKWQKTGRGRRPIVLLFTRITRIPNTITAFSGAQDTQWIFGDDNLIVLSGGRDG